MDCLKKCSVPVLLSSVHTRFFDPWPKGMRFFCKCILSPSLSQAIFYGVTTKSPTQRSRWGMWAGQWSSEAWLQPILQNKLSQLAAAFSCPQPPKWGNRKRIIQITQDPLEKNGIWKVSLCTMSQSKLCAVRGKNLRGFFFIICIKYIILSGCTEIVPI